MIPRSNLRSINHDTENLRGAVGTLRPVAGTQGPATRSAYRDSIVRLMGGKKTTVGRGGRVNYSALIAGGLVQIPIPPATMDRRARSLKVNCGHPPGPRDEMRLGCYAQLTGRQMRAHFTICRTGRQPLTRWTGEGGTRGRPVFEAREGR
jgi:hypothetical protein